MPKKKASKSTAKMTTKSEIMRHDEISSASEVFPPRSLSAREAERIEKHVEKHVGKVKTVLHEIFSLGIHLDVLPVEPTKKRPFKTFVTMGMSAIPMKLPPGYSGDRRLELCIVLPKDWPTDAKTISESDERDYWPIGTLRQLARLPSDFDTFLGPGHTVPNGDPPEPYSKSCKFVCLMATPPMCFDEAFATLKTPRFSVGFLQLIPIYEEEMNLVLAENAEALFSRFAEADLDPAMMFDPKRPNVGKPRKAGKSKR